MEEFDFWRLCDHLSVVQAALLIVGVDPASRQEYIDGHRPDRRPPGYDAVMAALTHSIRAGSLKASINGIASKEAAGQSDWLEDGENEAACEDTPNWHVTIVSVEDLKGWLQRRGLSTGFFFPKGPVSECLNTAGSFYAPKLAAAISAWQAVTSSPAALRRKSPKGAIEEWLLSHAGEFGLTKNDGGPNLQGIEEVAKVANWDTKGGAPRTPGG